MALEPNLLSCQEHPVHCESALSPKKLYSLASIPSDFVAERPAPIQRDLIAIYLSKLAVSIKAPYTLLNLWLGSGTNQVQPEIPQKPSDPVRSEHLAESTRLGVECVAESVADEAKCQERQA
jgi:hypothetical protein